MAKTVVESSQDACKLFDDAAKILGYDLLELCLGGPADKLDSTRFSQPAIFVASMAALSKLAADQPELPPQVSYAAGLSLGEYTALTFAGAISFEDALRVVAARGAAMQDAAEAVSGGMTSILGLDLPQVEQLCTESRKEGEVLQIANLLAPGNIVISGHKEACERAGVAAEIMGAMKAIPLAVAGAFHTSIMEPAVERLATALDRAALNAPRLPVVMNVDSFPHTDPVEIRDLLQRQVCSPVLWESSMRRLLSDGCDSFREVGPGRVLRGLLKRIDRKVPCDGVEGMD